MTDPNDNDIDAERASRLHSALVMEDLVSANQASNTTMISLIETVRKETAARDRKVDALEENQRVLKKLTTLAVAVCSLLLFMALFNAYNVLETRHNAERSAQISEDVKKTNDLLLDCLNSTGECGAFNAQQQKQVLDEVKKYELTGFYCIRNNPADSDPKAEKFLECMNRLYPGGPQLNSKLR